MQRSSPNVRFAHMDVSPELLVPPEAYGRGFCPHDAALVLDGWLRRLAAQDARGRTILGRLARAFLRRRGHHELGFGRLGDYSRERLGVSARELQSLATVNGRTVRALAAVMRTPPDGEDDDVVRFRLRCPRRVRLLWQEVVALARRMAGSELTQGQAAEAIAAEALSARLPCD